MPQAAGNAVISCICTAHTKYESNPLDWQRVIEISYRLFTRRDMVRFQEMCKDGLLGPGNYGIFKDWLDFDRLQDGYIRIRDGLVSEGEIREMNSEKNIYNKGPYQARVHGFFLAYHKVVTYCQWLLYHLTELEHYREFKVSLVRVMYLARSFIFLVLTERNFSIGTHIKQA
jgi:hypothetical protein